MGFTEVTQALFCGAGERKAHTTFEGDVEVAFAAAAPGAPPIAGVLRHVTLDVRPGSTASDTERDHEGERVLQWLGLKASQGPSGLAVETVSAGSRADAAGILPGDVLASFDGVRVGSPADVVPAPGARDALVGVRRGGGATESMKTVMVDGFRRAPPAELLGAALIAIAALAIVLLFAAPLRPRLAASLQRVVGFAHAARARRQARQRSRPRGGSWPCSPRRRGDALPPAGAPAMVDALVCALLAIMPFGQYLVAAQLDVGLLFVAAATALATAAGVAGTSPWSGLRAAAHVAWQHVPAAVAVASVVVSTGSLRVQEIEGAQGGLPWDWLAFRNPAALVALVLLLACARIEPEAPQRASGLMAHVEAPGFAGLEASTRRGPWLEAACRAHRLVVAGLASTLFLGAWVLPGLSPAAQDARPLLELLGAAWLLAKTWGLVALLAWARAALPHRRLAERSRRTALAFVPFSLAVLVASAVWSWWTPLGPAQLLVSGTLVAAAAIAALALAHRIRYGLSAAGAEVRLSPFI